MLEIKSLTVYRGELCVLKNISFKVNEKETVALIGPNCAGKTTLLESIIGIIKPKSGKISFLGDDITGLPSAKRVAKGLGCVFSREFLFPQMTVQENIELGAYSSKGKVKINERLEWIYTIFPRLRIFRKKKVSELSGGEQQMVAIARGIIGKPLLLMLDEPTSGLAPKIVLEIFNVISNLKKIGTTILLVEQYAKRALQISDRAYVLSSGKITLESESKALLRDENLKKYYFGLA